MSNLQHNMTEEEKIKFRSVNPLPIFCKYSYYNLFQVWCKKTHQRCKGNCAKTCPTYTPTTKDK